MRSSCSRLPHRSALTPLFATALFGAAAALASCVGSLAVRPAPPLPPPEPLPQPELVMGAGYARAEELAAFLAANNPAAEPDRVSELAALYVEEAAAEGVNHDVAFAQMCLETGFLRFGGLVTADMHNYCGLGALGPEQPGERFPSARVGVRAHIQHLKAYASTEPLALDLVDPRFKWVRRGSAPSIRALAGKWAGDPRYGEKIASLVDRLYAANIDP